MSLITAQVAPTLNDLKAAPIGNGTVIYDQATFKWAANSGIASDNVNVVVSDDTGFWIRQSATNIRVRDGGTVQDAIDARAISVNERTAANAALLASQPDGSICIMGGLSYLIDSSAIGSDSATHDLGVDGLVPFGTVHTEHFGLSATNTGAENLAALQAASDYVSGLGGGKILVRTPDCMVEGDFYLGSGVCFDNHGYTLTFNNGGLVLDAAIEAAFLEYWEAKVDIERTGAPGAAITLTGNDLSGSHQAIDRGRLYPIIRASTGQGIKLCDTYILDIFHPSIRNCTAEGWLFTYGPTGAVAVNAISIFGGETQQCERFCVVRGCSGVNFIGHTVEGNSSYAVIDHGTRGFRFINAYCEKNAFEESGATARDFIVQKFTQMLDYDALTASFTAGQTLTAASGGTATIEEVYPLSSTTGSLLVSNYSGTFSDNTALSDGTGGEATSNGGLTGSSPIHIIFDNIEFWQGSGAGVYPIRLVDGLEISVRNCRAASTAWTGLIDWSPSGGGAVTGEYGNNFWSSPTAESNVAPNAYFRPYDPIARELKGAAVIDLPSIEAGRGYTFTIAVTGLTPGAVKCSVDTAVNLQGCSKSAQCRTAGLMDITVNNSTVSNVDIGNATWRVSAEALGWHF